MYRIRSRSNKSSQKINFSLPKFGTKPMHKQISIKNNYLCLKQHKSNEMIWEKLLRSQTDMNSIVIAIQQNTTLVRMDAKQKLKLRQTFLLKKQIISCINSGNCSNLLSQLIQLKEKSVYESGLASLFIFYYQICQKILESNYSYNRNMISFIKNSVLSCLDKNQKDRNNILMLRILYIIALHLVKLEGVILREEDIQLITKSLALKKKYLNILGIAQFKNNLESLVFATFQFYKILYRLKRNQDLVLLYYNQIKAYIGILKENFKGFQDFQKEVRIQQKMENLVPVNFNLNIYKDHEQRRVLSINIIQKQLLSTHQRNPYIANSTITNSNFISKNKDLKQILSENQNNLCAEKQQCKLDQQNTQLDININKIFVSFFDKLQTKDLTQNKFSFDFILPQYHNVLKGHFNVKLNPQITHFTIEIKLSIGEECRGFYKTNPMCVGEDKTMFNFAKRVWSIIKLKFYTDKSEFMPSLFSFESPPIIDIPKDIGFSPELPILVAMHVIVVHYFRKQTLTEKMIGKSVSFPKKDIQNAQNGKLTESKKMEQKLFAKRIGFISFDRKLDRSNLNKNKIIVLFKKNEVYYVFLGEFDSGYFKEVEICKNRKNKFAEINEHDSDLVLHFIKYQKMISLKIRHLSKISRCLQPNKHIFENSIDQASGTKIVDKKKFVSSIQFFQKKDQIAEWLSKLNEYMKKQDNYKLERKFKMVQQENDLETKYNEINIMFQKRRCFKNKNYKQRIINKTEKRFRIAVRQNYSHLYKLKQENHYLLGQYNNCNQYQLVYRKFGLYHQYFFLKYLETLIFIRLYCQKANVLQRNQWCMRQQLKLSHQRQYIQLNHFRTIIVKIQKNTQKYGYFCINLFRSEQSEEIAEVYSFKQGKRMYCIIPQSQIFSQYFIDDTNSLNQLNKQTTENLIVETEFKLNNKYILETIENRNKSQKLICRAQQYYKIKTQILQSIKFNNKE